MARWVVTYQAPDGSKQVVGEVGAEDKAAALKAAKSMFTTDETRDNITVKRK